MSLTENLKNKSTLLLALTSNLSWLEQSIHVNKNEGSSAHKTFLGNWGPVYPETTGYLIPSLMNASLLIKKPALIKLVSQQVSFLSGLQNDDGSFAQSLTNKSPFVFDTAQILLGLMKVYESHANDSLGQRIYLAYRWLQQQMIENGRFENYTFKQNYNPSYFSRVLWPMILFEKKNAIANPVTTKAINLILEKQNNNLSFNDWSFDGAAFGLSHTIVYTLRGLWECALILEKKQLENTVLKTIMHLNNIILKEGKFAGSYNQDWRGDYSFICSAGNAQMAVLNLLCYKKYDRHEFLEPVSLLLNPLLKAQKIRGFNKGAISSSIPVYGKYQRFKYTNWTQKFFVDALIELLTINP